MNSSEAGRPPLDRALLTTASPAWASVDVVDEAPSTNALVTARATAGAEAAAHGLVVVAEHQTSGRGRLDRSWVTPPRAALTFSVLLRPPVPDSRWPWLPLLAGLSVVEGVDAAGGPRCGLKWPNDVVHDDRKLAGLLVERVETPDGPAAVLGVGINVTTTAAELPVPGAASLEGVGWRAPDRTQLLVQVLGVLGTRLHGWIEAGGDPQAGLSADYQARCVTLGRQVRVQLPAGDELVGTAVGVDGDGGLQVDPGSGAVTVSAGDVVHVRPA